MKIVALHQHQTSDWPELGTDALAPGLNVFYGPAASGKTTLADLATHALYGRRFVAPAAADGALAPQGEVVVDDRGWQFRLRRSHDEAAGERLTVSALDQTAVDQYTVRQLVAGLSPALLRPLYAVNFSESPQLEWLTSSAFTHEFRAARWRLKWAPHTIQAELRPVYARVRALEAEMAALVQGLSSEAARNAALERRRARARKRRASYFLSQLTGGELVELQLGAPHREPRVLTLLGESLAVDSLWSTQRDQVYLSRCLALVAALGRRGVRLPLVLDEPFTRLDARASAALVKVLDEFAAHGYQVLVFTAQQEATERSAELGACVQEMDTLRGIRAAAAGPKVETPPPRVRRRVRPHREQREAG